MPITVLIIDDHPLFSRGLAQLIETQKEYKVVAMAQNRNEALDTIQKYTPNLAIVDLNLGQEDGLDLIKDILIYSPRTTVLVLSMHDERYYAERALKAGAKGYIMKAEAETSVINAIRTVVDGKIYLSDKEKARIEDFNSGKEMEVEDTLSSVSNLSDRQLQIFSLIGKGLGTVEIASKLNLSIKTIDTHKENIKVKLHCASSAELRQMAIEWTRNN
ncbi:MAG: response regulator transcription factor [Treponema sp.]|nr:response regulator transcription factor [Treponema sp.]